MNRSTAVSLATLALLACRSDGIDTAAKLADALKEAGIAWSQSGPIERGRIKPPRAIDEAILLEGEDLRIEVYRVENEKWFKTAALGLTLRRSYEPEDSENALVDVFVRHPFLVAVSEEPSEYEVREALRRILPKDGEQDD